MRYINRFMRINFYTLFLSLILLSLGCSNSNDKNDLSPNTNVKNFSEQAEVYLEKGVSKLESEDYEGAITEINKALDENPRYSEALIDLPPYNRTIS